MTTEQRYEQLEKESLAFTWACERFADYLIGLKFHIHIDHKPLIPLFSTKNLEDLPVRIQRYCLRMMRFYFIISHVPGKQLKIADTLSRAPSDSPSTTDHTFPKHLSMLSSKACQLEKNVFKKSKNLSGGILLAFNSNSIVILVSQKFFPKISNHFGL